MNDWLENILEAKYQMKEILKIDGAWSNLAYFLGVALQAVGENFSILTAISQNYSNPQI